MTTAGLHDELGVLLDEARAALNAGDISRARLVLDAASAISPDDPAVARLEKAVRSGPPAFPELGSPGRYAEPRYLGSGSRKDVWYARDTLFERPVAIARVRLAEGGGPARDRAVAEARATARIGAHPHLVGLYEVIDRGAEMIFVEEFMAGGTLGDLLDRSAARQLDRAQFASIALGLCRGLAAVHARGYVHGDVKPRNIFVDDTGMPKLGDFGSALNTDRAGVMPELGIVGTALYLPPEQAIGGAVGPRSDLYGLGAVLYEALAGRPPFLGADATVVIERHLKERPVAPSWLNDWCSAAVEDFVLRLLEKEPAARFASAEDAAAAFAAALADEGQKPTARQREMPLERLAGGAFVGRAAEIEALQGAFRRAELGSGSLILISGEPGMGKSRLVEQLSVFAEIHGGYTLYGRARETPGAPALWPWIEVGLAFVAHAGLAAVQALGDSAAELTRVFPGLRDSLPGLPPPADESNPTVARLNLFGAYTRLVIAAAAERPALIILEDIHQADQTSLALLEHLAPRIKAARILILATLRPSETVASEGQSQLDGLRSREDVQSVALSRLTVSDVAAYLEQAAGIVPPQGVVREIARRVDGSPFFLVELVKYLVESGPLFAPGRLQLPDSISGALGLRVDKLSPPAAALMRDAAVFGRYFRADMLAALVDAPPDEVAAALVEPTKARVIEAAGGEGRFRFVHSMMRDALLARLDPEEIGSLNGRAGEVLEAAWGNRADERASRLAEHFFIAAEEGAHFRPRALHYLRLAAEQARAAFSWAQAARNYRRCLELIEATAGTPRPAALLEAHGVCARNAGLVWPAWGSLTEAIRQYTNAGDVVSVARVTIEAMAIPSEERGALVSSALDLLGDRAPELEGQLLTQRLMLRGIPAEQRKQLEARLGPLAAAYPQTAFAARARARAAVHALEAGDLERAAALADEAFADLVALNERDGAAVALLGGAMAWTQAGDLDRAAATYRRVMRYAAESQLHYMAGVCAMALAGLHRMRGEYDLFERMLALIPADNWTRQLYSAERAEQAGEAERCVSQLPPGSVSAGVPEWQMILFGSRARMLFNAGGAAAALPDFERWRATVASLTSDGEPGLVESLTSATPFETAIGLIDECLVVLGSDDEVRSMYDRLISHPWIRTGGDFRQLDRIRGSLAFRLGRDREAEGHYQAGLEWCERERCLVEAGRCLQGLAAVAARSGAQSVALRRLNLAAIHFAANDARLFLGQVVAEKLRLQGALGRDPESSIDLADTAGAAALAAGLAGSGQMEVTIVFTDIDESTPLTEHLGDAAWIEVLRAHNAIIRAELARFAGREVKTIGDAFMLAFPTPDAGLQFAISVQRAFAARNTSAPTPIRLTMGVHAGHAINEHGDLFGLDVVIASRVCTHCKPEEILVTNAVRDGITDSAMRFAAYGPVALKGISTPQQLFALQWEAT